ncbi:MAG: type IX secretion system outer membrane channel protein PorV [Bacteroidota bacterium]
MMKRLLSFSLIGIFCTGSYAQLTTDELLGQLNTITTAVPFLLISPDSKAGGMGDAGVASAPDVNSMHWNPSKYGLIDKKMGVGISYTPWLRALVPDINLAYVSFFYKPSKMGTFATSMRYFSLGNITFTDIVGNAIGQFNPNEFAIDVGYAQKLGENLSMGGAIRYVYSNLTNGVSVNGASSHPGMSVAADISAFYQNDKIEVSDKKSVLAFGINISNIGSKVSYTNTGTKDFIPINMRLGSALTMELDDYNSIGFVLDINKLLVPTPPHYLVDSTTGSPVKDANGQYVIAAGKDPNRSVVSGILGSFSDAPGGFREELKEFILAGGIEYWYGKPRIFAVRMGYFHEAATKGNRKYFTFGIGVKYNVFGLDFAYLVPTVQRNPLQNTLRFSLLFDFNSGKKDSDAPQE